MDQNIIVYAAKELEEMKAAIMAKAVLTDFDEKVVLPMIAGQYDYYTKIINSYKSLVDQLAARQRKEGK